MDIMAGETYALAVNNFTSTGAGFSIDWGGTVNLKGRSNLVQRRSGTGTICLGETIVYRDVIAIRWIYRILNWDLLNASPIGDTLQGPAFLYNM
ncbi:MAG: hypothetical protein R2778_06615 [Saprospiraceae bacterium]